MFLQRTPKAQSELAPGQRSLGLRERSMLRTLIDTLPDLVWLKDPKGVYGLLDQLWKPALDVAKKDRLEMQALLEKDFPGQKLQSWDWGYYEEKVRKVAREPHRWRNPVWRGEDGSLREW